MEVVIVMSAVVIMLVIVVVVQSLQLRRVVASRDALAAKPMPVTVTQPTAVELESRLKAAYEAKITEASDILGTDLQKTSITLREQVQRLTTNVIEEELTAYQETLQQVRQVATEAMEQIHQTVEHQRVELRDSMEQELIEEKKRLTAKFEAKFGDVVSSYISESLGSGVDLGAQMQFILTSLEKHKEEIRKDLLNGV